ncbi:hypothetical protein D2E25_0729 [Bifidobacterium goeldii]|uniref:Uncharacterized protein n=2 Tax=Bifidobacterium goeldii TaxID=2306975 RepID=A0A430FNM3_9BIFI|nr:hypothetical protein [Bifidobacterium goeldii]RSX54421.1 hypothetical protein D2E25_0729 [Bifidobacterium goeldii]
MTMRDSAGKRTVKVVNPRQELDDLVSFVNTGWLASGEFDGPTFLWNHLISDASASDDSERNNMPVAPPRDADTVISMPMQWYFDAIASIVPTAQRTDASVEMPRNDMPTFRLDSQALSGVDAVVGNALMSTRWVAATANLAKAVEVTARFVGNVADRDNEGFDYLKELIQNIRVYMDSVARNAQPQDGEEALRLITQVACNEDFQLNSMQMVELLACGLSFAQWDDTRMFAYDALNRALDTMDRFAREAHINTVDSYTGSDDAQSEMTNDVSNANGTSSATDTGNVNDIISANDGNSATDANTANTLDPDMSATDMDGIRRQTMAISAHQQFEQAILFLRHDLMRVSGDAQDADDFLLQHHDTEPLADAYVARLIAAERWEDLIDFINLVEHDRPNQYTVMFPEDLVPYEWESLREAALEALGKWDELRAMYRERIVEAYDPSDEEAITKLRAISNSNNSSNGNGRSNGNDGSSWAEQVQRIVHDYADGQGRYARNMIYERLMISEHLHDEAARYCHNFPDAARDLAALL